MVEGLGATADVMLANGTLKRGDRIVMCGFGGPVVTRVRELLTPRPLREMRVKTDYLHHERIDGSAGIKICANNLEGVVAGSACMVPYPDVPYDLECLKEDVMGDFNKLAKAASEVNGGIGVYAMASTLGRSKTRSPSPCLWDYSSLAAPSCAASRTSRTTFTTSR